MTEETKRRGRPPKEVEAIEPVAVVEPVEAIAPAPVPVTIPGIEPGRELTFAEVMAWNRANADLLAPAIELPKKQRPKSKRI